MTFSIPGSLIFPELWCIPPAMLFICRAGSPSIYTRKYWLAIFCIAASPPSQLGSGVLISAATSASMTLMHRAIMSPCFMIFLADLSSPAPTAWAICTVNPVVTAMHSPPNSHVVDETSPMAPDAFAPRRPTMDASMYCMTMDEIWARIAGMLSLTVSPICWDAVMDFPDIMSFSKFSLLLIYISFFSRIVYVYRLCVHFSECRGSLGKSLHALFHDRPWTCDVKSDKCLSVLTI